MILYNVTVKVEPESAAAWVQWMKTVHIPELMATGLFVDSRLCYLLEQDESEGLTYAAQYYCDSMNEYNNYIDNYADAFRSSTHKAFAGKFVAFRTVMEIL